MKEMMMRDIYDTMSWYVHRNDYQKIYDDYLDYTVSFRHTIGDTTYSVYMETKSFGQVNRVKFSVPRRVPAAKIKEAARVANELNRKIRFGAFRLVEHNGRVEYCFDSVLRYGQISTRYFEEVMDLSIRTLETYAADLVALCTEDV